MLLLNTIYRLFTLKTVITAVKFSMVFYLLIFFVFRDSIFAQSRFVNHEKNSFKSTSTYSPENRYSHITIDQLNRYDVKFYKLDLSVSKSSTEIQGVGMVYAEVQNSPVDTFIVELIDSLTEETFMIVDSVILNGQLSSFTHNNHLIKIPVDPPMPVGSFITATIYYYGNGHYSAASGYNGITNNTVFNSAVTYTYSQPFWSRIWWPCKQILGDKADSIHVSITTDSDCKAGSNGLLKSVVVLPGDKVRYEWQSNYPIDYYLVSFAVGEYIEHTTYAEIQGTTDSILIQSLLFQDSPYLAMNLVAIEKTKDYLQLFTGFFGDYPFRNEKYGYCLTANPWGAMEHQTMTTTGYRALDTTSNTIGSYYIWYTSHELGHSWFGNNVTCATWQDIWVNEGFANYCEYLTSQFLETQDRADYWMNHCHNNILSEPGGSVYVPDEYKNDEDRIFDYRLTYEKGGAIIHMIRYILANDSLFFLSLKNFQNEFANSVATGLDFKNVLETTSGMDFTDFFDQWYYGEGYPTYNIQWWQINDTLSINLNQITSTTTTPFFNLPIEIKFRYIGGDTTITVTPTTNSQVFQFNIPHSIYNVQVDPDNWIINKSNVQITGLDDNSTSNIGYSLSQNYPNPFNPTAKIKYSISELCFVTIKVFDVLGSEITTLVNEEKSVGRYEIEFNAKSLPSGIYIYRLQAGDFIETKKMVLMK